MYASPALYVDLDQVGFNIQMMASKAKKAGVEFRPHFKTHQSKLIGRMFRDHQVSGITVSSIQMANYFADDQWNDITIAFPANFKAAASYQRLLEQGVQLKTLISSFEVLKYLNKRLQRDIGLYIEIDSGQSRSGLPVSQLTAIESLKEEIEKSEHTYFSGFYCHAGQTYRSQNRDQIMVTATSVLEQLSQLKELYPDAPICFGDTPSCSILDQFGPASQISPGNFVFYDWMQVQIGSCSPNEIAVYMECPVVEKNKQRQQVLIHGGAVHFSKEGIQEHFGMSYGEPRLKYLSADTYLKSLSQEHGIVQCSSKVYDSIDLGDMIQIFPIHSCLTANLMRGYRSTEGRHIDHMSGASIN